MEQVIVSLTVGSGVGVIITLVEDVVGTVEVVVLVEDVVGTTEVVVLVEETVEVVLVLVGEVDEATKEDDGVVVEDETIVVGEGVTTGMEVVENDVIMWTIVVDCCLVDVVGSTPTDVDSVNKVELVDYVVEIDVVKEGDIVVDRVVVDAIVVDIGSETEEIIDGNGASQILYSQLAVYGPASVKKTPTIKY